MLVVPDVEEFPGHIACSSLSQGGRDDRGLYCHPEERSDEGSPEGRDGENPPRGGGGLFSLGPMDRGPAGKVLLEDADYRITVLRISILIPGSNKTSIAGGSQVSV